MVFASYQFLFLFLPITFLVYAIIRRFKNYKLAKIWLVIASFYFYGQGSRDFLPLFMLTVLFNYIIGRLVLKLNTMHSKWLVKITFGIGLVENVFLLGYYKYTYFLVDNINKIAGTSYVLNTIILPIGISFFTFQLIAFLVDCYKGKAKYYSFVDYLVFITFFPQLIVGPIVHHKEMVVQFEDEDNFRFKPEWFMLGILTFAMGAAKKVLLADPLIEYAQNFYNNVHAVGFFESWTAVFAYTFSYYFDFSGYGDMAIGLGCLFNIKLPINFNSPYKARNFAEFWRRWNMTLSQFLNDYIFKNIYHFGDKQAKLFFAVLVTFVVSGIWHGAGWHYILWGIVNGLLVCCAYVMTLHSKKLPFSVAWTLTFIGVLLTRVLFDSQNTAHAIHVYQQMFNIRWIDSFKTFLQSASAFVYQEFSTIALMIICAVITFGFKNTSELTKDFEPNWKNAVFAGVLITLVAFRMNEVSDFLYFQF